MPKIGTFEVIADVDIGDVDIIEIGNQDTAGLLTTTPEIKVDLKKINAVAPQLDDTDKLAVSIYGKKTDAGDFPIPISSADRLVVDQAAWGGSGLTVPFSASADGKSTSIIGPLINAFHYLFNGTNWDRQRNNVELTLLASAARTAETNSSDQTNYNGKGIVIIVDVTVDPAAAAITPTIDAKDPISGNYVQIWAAAAALSAVGTTVYILYPGNTDGVQLTDKDTIVLPRTWRFQMEVADADSMTYSVSGAIIL